MPLQRCARPRAFSTTPRTRPTRRLEPPSHQPPSGATRPTQSGLSATAVSFRATETAARHYPLPVVFENVPNTPAGGEPIERRAFLDGALHAERWQGLVFGVFKDRWNGIGLNDPDVNFHGLTVSVRLPTVEAVHGPQWTVAADIDDCPALELVLPARKEAVETPFLAGMRKAARLAIYRAMAADPDPRPSFEDRKRAHEADIDIAAPPAELRPWRASLADVDDWREPPKRAAVGDGALVMACDPEPPEAQTFRRRRRTRTPRGPPVRDRPPPRRLRLVRPARPGAQHPHHRDRRRPDRQQPDMSRTTATATADTGNLSLPSVRTPGSPETLSDWHARHFAQVEPKPLSACLPLSGRKSPKRLSGSGAHPFHSPDLRIARNAHVRGGRDIRRRDETSETLQLVIRANTRAVTRGT